MHTPCEWGALGRPGHSLNAPVENRFRFFKESFDAGALSSCLDRGGHPRPSGGKAWRYGGRSKAEIHGQLGVEEQKVGVAGLSTEQERPRWELGRAVCLGRVNGTKQALKAPAGGEPFTAYCGVFGAAGLVALRPVTNPEA